MQSWVWYNYEKGQDVVQVAFIFIQTSHAVKLFQKVQDGKEFLIIVFMFNYLPSTCLERKTYLKGKIIYLLIFGKLENCNLKSFIVVIFGNVRDIGALL